MKTMQGPGADSPRRLLDRAKWGPARGVRRPWRPGVEGLESRQLLTIAANADLFGLIEGTPLTVQAPGVLANDRDSTGAVLHVSASTQPTHGSLTVAPSGAFVYTPAAGYTGSDSFTYTASDASGALAVGAVGLTVAPYRQEATVFAGPRLASVSTSQSALLNGLLGGLTGTGLNLTAADWTGLGSAQLNGGAVAGALQAELGLASPSQALAANATLSQILNAAATVAQADGDTAAVSALNGLSTSVAGLTTPVQLGSLLQVNPNDGSLANTSLNALDLVTGAVQLFNFDNVATTPTPVTISGSSLGLPTSIGSVQLSAQVVEPPIITTGPSGTAFHSAAIRLGLTLNLASGALDLSSLTGPLAAALGGLVTVNATGTLAQVPLYVDVAEGQGTIATVDAIGDSVTLQATPGVANVYLGAIPANLFDDRTRMIDPAMDVGFATIGNLNIVVTSTALHTTLANVTTGVQARSTALGAAPSATTEVFNGPFPQTQTVTTGASFITNLASSLVSNLQVQLSGDLGTLLDPAVGTILPVVTSAVSGVVTPLLGPVLTGAVDPALQALGAGLGELVLTVDGVGLVAAPVANPDSATTAENTPVTIPVLANDATLPGDAITVTSTTAPAQGVVALNPDGTLSYTPTAGFTGMDSFSYTITDRYGQTSTAAVSVDVVAPPVAVADSYTATSGVALTIGAPGVLANDTDPNGFALTSQVVTGPAHGTLTLNADGSFTYDATAGYYGPDGFTYQDSDGANLSAPATVTLAVNPAPPVARPDAYTATAGTPLNVPAPGVLGNDTDPDGLPLSAVLVAGPAHGSLTLNADGSFTYTAPAAFFGADSFTYEDSDGANLGNPTTVSLSVNPAAPVARGDGYSATSGTPLTVNAPGVLGNDTDPAGRPLSAFLVAGPAHGTITLNANGSFTYNATAGYYGPDSFTYLDNDGASSSAPATVTLAVNPAPPVARPDAYTATAGAPLNVPASGVLGNDADPDGLPLSAVLVAGPAHGSLALNANGSFTYTAATAYYGPDSFTYEDSDGANLSTPATVTLTVNPASPVARPDAYAATSGTPLIVPASTGVLANDTDPAGRPLAATVVTGPAHGTLTLNRDGSFTYAAAAGYSGPDSFTYADTDGAGISNPATVSLTVNPAPPVARADSYTAITGVPLAVNAPGVLSNDSGPAGYTLAAQVVTGPAHGTLSLNANGSLTYTATPGYLGADSFTYRDGDGLAFSAPATVTLAVAPASPVAQPDNYMAMSGISLLVAAPGVLSNDTGPAGYPLTAQLVTGPAHGTLSFNPNGSFTYTAALGYVGSDTFTYRDLDGAGASAPATVSLTVRAMPPVARADSYSAISGTPLVVSAPGVLANDTGPAGFILIGQLMTGPAHGTLSFNPNGSFTYTATAGYTGADSFAYRDAAGGSYSPYVMVSLAVSPGAPVARNDSYTAIAGTPLAVSSPGVLGNDTGPAGFTLTAQVVTSPAHGTLSFNANGSFTYTATAGYSGPDGFTYRDVAGPSVGAAASVSLAVSLPPRVVQTFPVKAMQGVPFANVPVLTFSDPGTKGSPLASTALINWGDGSAASVGTVTAGSGVYVVSGGHTYQSSGSFVVTVAVRDPNNGSFTAVTSATVTPALGSISGLVFGDLNGDGARQATDGGLGGQTILLAGTELNGTNINLSTTTAADGSYRFAGLPAGNYALAEISTPAAQGERALAGTLGGTTASNLITAIPLGAGGSGLNYNFAEKVTSDIRGTVYIDNSRDGRDDPVDFGVANVEVVLTGTDILGNHISKSMMSAADGTYDFAGLIAGTYQVVAEQPGVFDPGRASPGTAGGTASGEVISGIALKAGTDASSYNFGEFIKSTCVLALPAYQRILRYGPHPTGIPASAFIGVSAPPGSLVAYYVPVLAEEIQKNGG